MSTYTSSCPALDGLTYDSRDAAIAATCDAGGCNAPYLTDTDDGTEVRDDSDELLGVVSTVAEEPDGITYSYLDDTGLHCHGTYTGLRYDAWTAGVDALGATKVDDGWCYRDVATGTAWIISEDDLCIYGAAVLSGHQDIYNIWCSETPATLTK